MQRVMRNGVLIKHEGVWVQMLVPWLILINSILRQRVLRFSHLDVMLSEDSVRAGSFEVLKTRQIDVYASKWLRESHSWYRVIEM